MRMGLVILVMALGTGCASGSAPQLGAIAPAAEREAAAEAADRRAQEGVVYFSGGSDGTGTMLQRGATLRIELSTVPTAGYIWQVVSAPPFLELTGEGTRPTDPAAQDMPGFTGGNHYMSFDFYARSEGTGDIVLEERRPWEDDQPPSDTYTLTVSVSDTAAE